MSTEIVQAYDKTGTAIYPRCLAAGCNYVPSPALTSNDAIDNAQTALNSLFYQCNDLYGKVTGADLIQLAFNATVVYARNNDSTTPPIAPTDWSETFDLPDDTHTYTWKKTTYTWSEVTVKEVTEIVATANYPETQFLYTAQSSNIAEFTGPNDNHKTNDGDFYDKTNESVIWSTKAPSISTATPCLYMVTRYRKANQTWKDVAWGAPALIGNYAFNSIVLTKYKIQTSSDTPSPNNDCATDGTLSSWADSVEYTALNTGTNYIFLTLAISVNGAIQKAYSGQYWSTPSLISIINK